MDTDPPVKVEEIPVNVEEIPRSKPIPIPGAKKPAYLRKKRANRVPLNGRPKHPRNCDCKDHK